MNEKLTTLNANCAIASAEFGVRSSECGCAVGFEAIAPNFWKIMTEVKLFAKAHSEVFAIAKVKLLCSEVKLPITSPLGETSLSAG